MSKKTLLITGGYGALRQRIVEKALRDPENSVICVELLTPESTTVRAAGDNVSGRISTQAVLAADMDDLGGIAFDAIDRWIDLSDFDTTRTVRTIVDGETVRQQIYRRLVDRSPGLTPTVVVHNAASDASAESSPEPSARAAAPTIPEFTLALPSIFGPGETSGGFCADLVSGLLASRPQFLAADVKQWVYIDDAAEAILLANQHARPGVDCVVNNDGAHYSEAMIAEFVCDQLDQIVPRSHASYRELLHVLPRLARFDDISTSAVPLNSIVSWVPENDFFCALASTVRWYVDQPDWWLGDTVHRFEAIAHASGQ